MVWRVGGIDASSIHIKVFSGVSAGLSLCFCVGGGNSDLCRDFEYFDTKFVRLEDLSLLVWRVGGVGVSSVHIEVFSGVPAGLSLCFVCCR